MVFRFNQRRFLVFSDLMSRRLVAVTLVGACALGLVACGDDKADTTANLTTTTTTTPTTTTDAAAAGDPTTTADGGSTPEDSSPESTGAQLPFAEGVAQLRDSIEAADGDACKLYAVYTGEFRVEEPKTPDEVRQAIELTTSLFNGIADSAPADQADAVAKIKSGVETMKSSMEASNYSVESFSAGGYFNQDLQDGLKAFATTAETTCK